MRRQDRDLPDTTRPRRLHVPDPDEKKTAAVIDPELAITASVANQPWASFETRSTAHDFSHVPLCRAEADTRRLFAHLVKVQSPDGWRSFLTWSSGTCSWSSGFAPTSGLCRGRTGRCLLRSLQIRDKTSIKFGPGAMVGGTSECRVELVGVSHADARCIQAHRFRQCLTDTSGTGLGRTASLQERAPMAIGCMKAPPEPDMVRPEGIQHKTPRDPLHSFSILPPPLAT